MASLQFSFAGTLAPGQTLTLAWPMAAPPNAPVGTVAWNSFGFTGFRTDTGAQLTPAEPNKVGIEVDPYPLMLMKQVNGQTEETPPGLFVPVGQPVTYTYLVTNPGDLTVGSVNLTDSPAQTITCPSATIPPHGTIACTAAAGPATAGQHADTATVSGQPLINGSPAGPATAPVSDTANYFGSAPALTLVKDVNGQHQPDRAGPVRAGRQPGDLHLPGHQHRQRHHRTPSDVTDNQLGAVTCPETVLAPGDSETCTAAAHSRRRPPPEHGHRHRPRPSTTPARPSGLRRPRRTPRTTSAPPPAISVVKDVKRPARADRARSVRAGGRPGDLHLRGHQHRQRHAEPCLAERQRARADHLPGPLTRRRRLPRRAPWPAGAATAGRSPEHRHRDRPRRRRHRRARRNSGDRDRHSQLLRLRSSPQLVKSVNGQPEPAPPGLFVPVGDPVTFTYVVTNTGNVTLNPVTLRRQRARCDHLPRHGARSRRLRDLHRGRRTGDGGSLHQNTATATGQGVDNTGAPVGGPATATDTANYFGSAPAISVVKDVNGQPEPTPPGLFVGAASR